MKTIIKILLWIWQCPQHIIGLVLLAVLSPGLQVMYKWRCVYLVSRLSGAISLGEIVITGTRDKNVLDHEYGHTIQSRRLGPLYLLIIGLPSIVWAGIYLLICKLSKPGAVLPDYYGAPWEADADRLGGVVR